MIALISNHQSQEVAGRSFSLRNASLVLLLLCSSFFAFYNSNSAYTSDEVWSVKTAALNYRSGLAALRADVHPPLYFLILHSWIPMFGTTERAVRSLSAVFYILSVFAVFGIGRALYGSKTALLCATIYLSSPLGILSAQFARMYSLLSLLSILSTWLYLRFSVKPRDSRLLFALYIVVNVLGTFTHIGFFFLLFAQIVVYLLLNRSQIKRLVLALTLSVIPYLFLWGPILLAQITNSGEGAAWVKKPSLSMLGDLLFIYGGAFWLVLPVLLYVQWRSRSESSGELGILTLTRIPPWLLAITLLTPILLSIVKPIFNSRLAIVAVHLFALSVGWLTGRGATYLLSLAIIALTATFITIARPASSTCDNRQMAVYLSQTAEDGDVVIFTSLTRLPIDYYLERTPDAKRLFEISFPAEIDLHPGYEGSFRNPARQAALEIEAKILVDKIGSMPMKRIFFFHGFHPEIDSIVERHLRGQFELQKAQAMRCSDGSPYFNEVSVYK